MIISSTNSSDRLALFLYATIHDHSCRQRQWKQWNITTVSSAQLEESMETPMFLSASQSTTLEKPLLEIVYFQQLQQVISNDGGGPQLPTQGCVYAYRAASQMGGTFSPQWREQRENLKQFYDILDYKKMSRMILTISGWLFTQLCSNTL